jgi:hypothetical protein
MHLIPLALFPDGSLRESVVTTVWVGVFVISFFNLRFGWTYSGLVVPGYLVPLLLTTPASAFITVAEGILAYGIVWFVSEYLSSFGWWCNFFGRDRFFAIFLSAVVIRVTFDGWCLPALASWLQQQWNFTLDYKSAFHSFGMIVIALIANQFWKTGLRRGLIPFASSITITFLLVRFVLMTLTNFNLGHVAYLYSSPAASLLASPKAYIILIVTGFVASRMNLSYGWEYNGILIPALLALQWYDPLKIVSSLAEAAVVYTLGDLLLRSPLFRGVTIENARKLLLFFNVAYVYRLCLGFVLPWISPGVTVNDYYGFAYLLSSLMAVKMHSKHIALRLTRATLQTSFFAAVAANLLGLWLASLFGSISLGDHPPSPTMAPLYTSAESVEQLAVREELRLFGKRAAGTVTMPTPGELNRFQDALELIRKHAQTREQEPLLLARRYLHELHYSLTLLQSQQLCLREQEPARGWGFYCISLKNPHGLLLEVPAPIEEWSVMESAVHLYNQLSGSAIAIAGGGRFASKDGSSDVLANAATPFEVFHRVFARQNVLQARGYTDEALRHLPSVAAENALYVKAGLPRSLSPRALQDVIGDFRVFWSPGPMANIQQQQTRTGFAELWLSRPTRIGLKAALAESFLRSRTSAVPNNSLMLEWLLDQKRLLAKAGTGAYVPPLPEEVSFFDEEILTPLLEVVQKGYRADGLTRPGRRLVQAVNSSAWLLGYQVSVLHDASREQDFLILTESPQALPKRGWGTVVLRLGQRRPFVVQVPRPLFDLNTLECGVQLFDRLQAESIVLAGAHNEANQDQTADVLDFRNAANLFSLVNQVVLRQAQNEPKMVVQCRGYAPDPGPGGWPEVLVAFQDGINNQASLTPLGRTLVDAVLADGFRFEFVNGSPVSAGYEISCVPQAQYVSETTRKEFAILWLSPTLRDVFRQQDDTYPLQVQLQTLGIRIVPDDLKARLRVHLGSGNKTRLPLELKGVLDHYAATMDIVSLQRALTEWPQFEFSGLLDRNSRQLLLLVSDRQSALPAVLNLRPRSVETPPATGSETQQIDLFLASRGAWLEPPL